ncbi:MAG TPA: Spy/CpxP family protein refolding chaperone [Candidatus Krumholzibacteria bacterium]|nr:Spy/CpxP family protein refolding chaperone [Candidatus Krumholzibacteria bacterium]
MSTRNRNIALMTAAIVILSLSGLALAQGPGQGPGKGMGRGPGAQAMCDGDGPGFGPGFGPERGIAHLKARLNLSDEQVKAITDLQEASRTKNTALRKDMMRLRNELEGEMLKDAPDAKAVKGLVGKIGDLRTQMQQNRMETRLAVRAQLTPEQRDKMLLMGEGRGHGRGERAGRDGFRGARGGRGGCDGDGPHGRGPGRGCGGACPKATD